jgi:acyl-coenzyme A synthetase/AMP-(fatty) acid ligase
VTYRELRDRVRAMAAWLRGQGLRGQELGPGSVVAIHLGNELAFVEALFAAAHLGADIVPLHPSWRGEHLRHALSQSGAVLMVTRDPDAPGLGDVRAVPPPDARPLLAGAAPETPTTDALPCRLLLFTSGSTGMPRLVIHRGQSVETCARGVAQTLTMTPADCTLGLLPLAFHYGLTQVTSAFAAGGSCALHRAPMPAAALDTAAQAGCTIIAAVPGIWGPMLAVQAAAPRDLRALRCVTNAGGRPGRALLEALPSAWPSVAIVLYYGQTEVLRSTWLPAERFSKKPGAIGGAFPGTQVAVVDERGAAVADGEIGELVHGGSHLPVSVAGREPQACAALGGRLGWWTGDQVRRDADGVLWFEGRTDDMLKVGGFRIGPGEVEDAISRAAAVAEVVVTSREDPVRGTVLVAAIRSHPGEPVEPADIRRWCRLHLPGYMVPSAVHVWTAPWPRTATGKIDRRAIGRADSTPPPLELR